MATAVQQVKIIWGIDSGWVVETTSEFYYCNSISGKVWKLTDEEAKPFLSNAEDGIVGFVFALHVDEMISQLQNYGVDVCLEQYN